MHQCTWPAVDTTWLSHTVRACGPTILSRGVSQCRFPLYLDSPWAAATMERNNGQDHRARSFYSKHVD